MKNVRRNRQIIQVTFGVGLALAAQTHVAAAGDKWLACKGTLTATELTGTKTEPSERVLAYNDEMKTLHQWQDKKKTFSFIPTVSYTPEQITWGKPNALGFSGAYWEGKLNRSDMSLMIERTEGKPEGGIERMTWNEKCAPTQPLNGSEPAVAATEQPAPSTAIQ